VLNLCLIVFFTVLAPGNAAGQQPADKPAAPPVDEWADDFSGSDLNPANWERFTFEGGSGGTLKVEQGELRLRSVSGARAGVLSKQAFKGDHFLVEGTIAKVGPALPEPGQSQAPGNAIVTVLFDSSGRNRVEWLLTTEGLLEAWAMTDGRSERLDGRNLATKTPNPTLAIVRRGDEFLFMLNGQEGLRKRLKSMPRSFHVMLYGFGSSENNWDSVRVVTVKQSQ
jgi:hypothetical protein